MPLTDLLSLCVKENASDLHLTPGESPILRVNGDLRFMTEIPPFRGEVLKDLLYSIMTPEQQKEFETTLELDFAAEIPGLCRFRINVFYQSKGIAAVCRRIPETVPDMDSLGLPAVFKRLLALPNGLILVTGPTGSGKSTTLAAMVDYINLHQASHIITIEDPIEFIHTNKKSLINQRQVKRDTHDFKSALRAALREDPDVILLGEMRDLETIRLALTAAETGHLVMATLHTSSAPHAISRIVDVFPSGEKDTIRNMLAESLRAVMSQVLVKKDVDANRVAAFEIMLGTNAIRNLIREDKIAQMYTTIQTSGEVGMCTLEQYLQQLVSKKIISTAATRGFNNGWE